MSIFNYLSKVSAGIVVCYVIDIILAVGILGALCYILYKNVKQKSPNASDNSSKTENQSEAQNSDDVQYVIPQESEAETQTPPINRDNKIEHFSNQIFDISEEASSELKSKVVSKPKEFEEPTRRVVKDETINLTEKPSAPVKTTSFNNTTSLLNTLKTEQVTPPQNQSKNKPAATKAKKSTKTTKAASSKNSTKTKKDEQ